MYEPYFTNDELKCRCGECGLGQESMNPDFMAKVINMRRIFGSGLAVSSAIRCPAYNNKVSSSGLTGAHTTGHAMDILIAGDKARALLTHIFASNHFTGIGINQKGSGRFIHIDDIENDAHLYRPAIWTY